jgi:glutathione S-transferase
LTPYHCVLYSAPSPTVSNNGARCRVIIYKKGIEDQVRIASPMDIGGLKSPEYLALNPQGKMPLLVADEITLPESDTICRYLLDRFSESSPSFMPSTAAARARSDLLCRLHDMYVTTIQGALYKATPPFGIYGSRLEALDELRRQLLVLNDAADATGPYLAGKELSLADATVFPTMIFVAHMLPLFSSDGAPLDIKAVLGGRLGHWYLDMKANDPVFKRVLHPPAVLRVSRMASWLEGPER